MTPRRPNYTSATCEMHRNHGPKGVHGCVTLEFKRASAARFSSSVNWPSSDNYDLVIERAILAALGEIESAHLYECRLVNISWHPIDSCAAGFAMAARLATHAALDPL